MLLLAKFPNLNGVLLGIKGAVLDNNDGNQWNVHILIE
jgi:hypothetical protein